MAGGGSGGRSVGISWLVTGHLCGGTSLRCCQALGEVNDFPCDGSAKATVYE